MVMQDDAGRSRYRAYLLRCWVTRDVDPARGTDWRFSLEDPHTGHRRSFASFETLVAALRADLTANDRGGMTRGSDAPPR
jgi:hypothetical protein